MGLGLSKSSTYFQESALALASFLSNLLLQCRVHRSMFDTSMLLLPIAGVSVQPFHIGLLPLVANKNCRPRWLVNAADTQNILGWRCLQIRSDETKFSFVHEMRMGKFEARAREQFQTAEQGFKHFGDISGRFSDFSDRVSFRNSKLLGGQCRSAEVPP